MSQITTSFLRELEREAATTRRLLERVPENKFEWQPHPTSMTLKRLASHIAETPGIFARMLTPDGIDFAQFKYVPPEAASTADILALHDKSIESARQFFSGLSDEKAEANWIFSRDGKEIMSAPRIAWVRSLMLSHWIHHRGQLSVFLRMLEVPIPSIYGPSGDENPFSG
jgi:uncharacterized damage-inducible protein DinB